MSCPWLLQLHSYTVLSRLPQAVNPKCFPLSFSSWLAVAADSIKKRKNGLSCSSVHCSFREKHH